MLTAVPAAKWNIPERGLLREGFMADVNIFDPERIGPRMPELVHDLPGGARRLRQGAEGILATLVNGEVVLEEGNPTGALSGKLVRDAGRHF
jgi:N-acyl-D-aspartate/D-glutamate deacylase